MHSPINTYFYDYKKIFSIKMPEGEEYYTKYKDILEQFPRLNQSSILQDIQQKGPIYRVKGKCC